MSERRLVLPLLPRRYRPTLTALLAVASIALWPGLLFPLARAYVEFSLHHPLSWPLSSHYPPFVVAALIVWLAPAILVALALAAWQALGQYRLEQRIRGRRVEISAELASIARRVGVTDRLIVVASSAPFAFCAGFFRPAIYVSDGLLAMLDPDEIEAVVRHEASHLRHRDPLRLFLIQLLQLILAPLPIVETLCDRARLAIELAADRAALAVVPMPALAGAVLKVARAGSAGTRFTIASLSASEARIDALLGRPIDLAFGRRDLALTGVVLLTTVAVLLHLASIKLCSVCPTL